MDKNPAHLVGAKLIDRPPNLVDALLDDPFEHESEAKLFDASLTVGQYLRRTIITCREGHQPNRCRASAPELPGCHVGSESDPFHNLLHTFPGSFGNVRHAIDDSRHRMIRD